MKPSNNKERKKSSAVGQATFNEEQLPVLSAIVDSNCWSSYFGFLHRKDIVRALLGLGLALGFATKQNEPFDINLVSMITQTSPRPKDSAKTSGMH
ncbi:hypothetical protein RCL_jg10682.t1 [Rhizophagus clarus]|uniref:Uncharacterized protein n=1 Tax=Rhizophagus clarus TaxID=94130 RepID=A0A8H3L602_9GLOM|nr:hypothetical protein RCL_jg10682.t1 [Rhizophagus clarus]